MSTERALGSGGAGVPSGASSGAAGGARALAVRAFRATLDALDPARLLEHALAADRALAGAAPASVLVLGAGKAAARMSAGVEAALGPAIAAGFAVTKDGHASPAHASAAYAPAPGAARSACEVELVEAAHPVPDARSERAGRELLARAAHPPVGVTRIVALWSGGASALAAVPAPGLALADKAEALARLARAGVPITELNCVRKHLSALKGGWLGAQAVVPISAHVLSDVVGDDLATVGGGPFHADPTSYAHAHALCAAAGIELPHAVARHLARGAAGELAETPKPGDARLAHIGAALLAGPDDAGRAFETALRARGCAVELTLGVACDVSELASQLVASAHARAAGARACAHVFSGEPTVRVPPAALRGGRAQHTALLVADALARTPPSGDVAVLCVATDGTDGPTSDAGGLVDAASVARALGTGVDVRAALARFDSGTALAAAGDLVTTGPTGNNLCDLYAVIALPQRAP